MTHSTVPARRLRILLAEDNPFNQRLAVRLLEKRGHAVLVAGSALELLAAWEKGAWDLILTMMELSNLNAFEATAMIRRRENKTRTHVGIIGMTTDTEYRIKCLGAGLDGYVSRPIRWEELAIIERLVAVIAFIDWGHMAMSDPQLAREWAELYLKEFETELRCIRDSLRHRNPEELRRNAHIFKGGLHSVGFIQVISDADWQAAQRLENMGRGNDLTGAEESYATLERASKHLELVLYAFLNFDKADKYTDIFDREIAVLGPTGWTTREATGGQPPNTLIDEAIALAYAAGNWSVLRDQIDIFLRGCPRLLSQIRGAIASRDGKALEGFALTLQGLVTGFGAWPARGAAQRLVLIGHAGALRFANEACAALEGELTRLLPVLESLKKRATSPAVVHREAKKGIP
jgi:CheY-like chemotaxis protein